MSRRMWTVEEKLSMVLEMVKGQESITSLCHRHGVAMSQPRALNPKLVAAIEAFWSQTRGVYGYRKIHAMLRAQGWRVNHRVVLRHLRRMNRLQPRKLKGVRWTRPRVVHPTVSNTYWEMDLTYVWCGSGFGYLFAVLDTCDKGIPGAHCGDRCRAVEAVQALYETERLHESLDYQTPAQCLQLATHHEVPR